MRAGRFRRHGDTYTVSGSVLYWPQTSTPAETTHYKPLLDNKNNNNKNTITWTQEGLEKMGAG